MRRGRRGALPRGTAERTLTSVGTSIQPGPGEETAGAEHDERTQQAGGRAQPGERAQTGGRLKEASLPHEREVSRLWHVTLSVSGKEAPLKEVRRALEQLAHDHPFLLTSRYANDHAEIRYWEEARDLHDAAAVALRLWGEHRSSAKLPPWEIVGLEVIDRETYHQRIAEGYGPPPASPVGVHPY
ncbi:hypothetical protein AB0I82_10840 [Streptomyces sp. NPDC050315]|uniref:hypothetical protein n=1 Tax=Streptomyces sp. NPDC050315 TaxID=3155039 RepID=UPI00342A3F7B